MDPKRVEVLSGWVDSKNVLSATPIPLGPHGGASTIKVRIFGIGVSTEEHTLRKVFDTFEEANEYAKRIMNERF